METAQDQHKQGKGVGHGRRVRRWRAGRGWAGAPFCKEFDQRNKKSGSHGPSTEKVGSEKDVDLKKSRPQVKADSWILCGKTGFSKRKQGRQVG